MAACRRHFDTAVFAAHELMQLVSPDMIAAGGGSIVNITSIASRMPGDGPYPDRSGGVLPGYGGSKAKPILTPGLAYYAREFVETAPAAEFARAAVELALVDPNNVTGRTIGHRQVLDGIFRTFTPD